MDGNQSKQEIEIMSSDRDRASIVAGIKEKHGFTCEEMIVSDSKGGKHVLYSIFDSPEGTLRLTLEIRWAMDEAGRLFSKLGGLANPPRPEDPSPIGSPSTSDWDQRYNLAVASRNARLYRWWRDRS
jgi:hypothetical protein